MYAAQTLPCAESPASPRFVVSSVTEDCLPMEAVARVDAYVGRQRIRSARLAPGEDLIDALSLPTGLVLDCRAVEAAEREAADVVHADLELFAYGFVYPVGESTWDDVDLQHAPFAAYPELEYCDEHIIWHDGSQSGWAHVQNQLAWARNPLSGVSLCLYDAQARAWRPEAPAAHWRLALAPLGSGAFVPTLYLESDGGRIYGEVEYQADRFHGELAYCPTFMAEAIAARVPGAADALASLRSLYRAYRAGRIAGPVDVRFAL